jgi:surfeit locus 1 family protein
MKYRILALCLFSSFFAIVCIWLGLWQLDRHSETQMIVRQDEERLARAPKALGDLLSQGSPVGNTPVHVEGRYDLRNEIVHVNRTRRGAPGVNILTPLILPGSDTAVLVNRGWVYSPDGSSVDLRLWRDSIPPSASEHGFSQPVSLRGLANEFSENGKGGSILRGGAGTAPRMSRITRDRASEVLPYPVSPVQVQLLPVDTFVRPGVPVPLPPPSLSSGPHMSYAIQWFAFAAIAIVGCWIVARQSHRAE